MPEKILYLHSCMTKIGRIRMASTKKGLSILLLPKESQGRMDDAIAEHFADYEIDRGGAINKLAEKQLAEYFDGKRKNFSIPLDIQAPAFYKTVLERVARIPYGTTMSYSEVAMAIGNPRAMRAVGTANAGNQLPVVIPCHRVVRKDGIGLYGSSGVDMKRKLLAREGVFL